jgi:hypothetical protein
MLAVSAQPPTNDTETDAGIATTLKVDDSGEAKLSVVASTGGKSDRQRERGC